MVSVSQLPPKMDASNSNDLIDCHRVVTRNSCTEISCMTTVEKHKLSTLEYSGDENMQKYKPTLVIKFLS